MAQNATDGDDSQNAFDIARDNDKKVNSMLAGTDGKIAEMHYAGAIGYHIYIANGETSPEYLWKTALLQALDDVVFEMMYFDSEDVNKLEQRLERELKEYFDHFTAEMIAERTVENIENIQSVQKSDD